jgi:hypothetical protein
MKWTIIAFATAAPIMLVSNAVVAAHVHHTDEELVKLLAEAAPAEVVGGATILNMNEDGSTKVVKQGTNGWTCMDPGGAPMCADEGGMEWGKAYMSKGPAPQKLGFIYMLRGDNGASNTDPYAIGETADNHWIKGEGRRACRSKSGMPDLDE